MRESNKEPKIMVVKWADAWGSMQYYNKKHDYTPMIMTDVGFLCEENDESIVLCMSWSEDDDSKRHLTVIPWEFVVSVEVLA